MFSIGAYAECSLIPAERYSIKYDGVELPLLRKGIHMGEGDLEDFYAIALVDGEFELSDLDEILTSDKELVLCVDGKPVRHDGAFLHHANVTPFSIDEKEMKVIMEHQLAKRDQSLLLMLRNAVNQGVPSLLDDLICEFNTLDNNFVAGVGFEKSVTLYDKAWLGTFIQSHNIEFIERKLKLCADESRIDAALADAIEQKGKESDYCSLVYGNIPTRYIEMFHQSLNYLEKHMDYDMAISMQNVEKNHPDWMYDFNEEILPRKKEVHYRRQMLPQKMQSDGHTFIFRIKKFLDNYKGLTDYKKEYALSVYGEKIKPVINDKVIIDIDTEKDMKISQYAIK